MFQTFNEYVVERTFLRVLFTRQYTYNQHLLHKSVFLWSGIVKCDRVNYMFSIHVYSFCVFKCVILFTLILKFGTLTLNILYVSISLVDF